LKLEDSNVKFSCPIELFDGIGQHLANPHESVIGWMQQASQDSWSFMR
jgi:hypothetical protein